MRIALGIEYDGTDFCGWQRLSHAPSVQESVEKALSKVADHPVQVHCAGRTDSGVHARCQVVHFDTRVDRSLRSWVLGGCSNLPQSIAVLWARQASEDFHARHVARARRYRYTLLNRAVRPALDARYVAWHRKPLDAGRMQLAAQALLGEHDFSAFRAAACQAPHARRNVQQINVRREDDRVLIDIQANAFLHHMVRNIVGSLLPIGEGEKPVPWLAELLAAGDRDAAGPTAAASGLCFVGPRYPASWGLPVEVTL